MATRKLIDVVTIVLNGRSFVEKTLKSVVEQDYSDFSFVVVDGGSTDGTVRIIEKYEKGISAWVSESDRGIGDAFNKGVGMSKGRWVIFMNGGDSFASPNVLSEVAQVLETSAAFDIVHGNVRQVDANGKYIRRVGAPINPNKFRYHLSIPHQAVFHNREYFEKNGLFNLSFKIAMDYELLTRKKHLSAKYVNIDVSETLLGGISQQNYRNLILELRKIRAKNIAPRTVGSDLRYLLTYLRISAIVIMRRMFGEKFC